MARYAAAVVAGTGAGAAVADRLERAVDCCVTDRSPGRRSGSPTRRWPGSGYAAKLVAARLATPTPDLTACCARMDIPENRSWRPFQLAFVLLCLPALADPGHPDARRGAADLVAEAHLLFFPTGGGKTEAYLGLTAFTIAIRRLQGVVGWDGRDGRDGVAVLMRYTLRLLTAQQFQRAAALLCACELLRRERRDRRRRGGARRRSGSGCGSGMASRRTRIEDADEQLEQSQRRPARARLPSLQLARCPWCGSRLDRGRDVQADATRAAGASVLRGHPGHCPFTEAQRPDEGLPVVVVDEEIYRLPPALVIATVDKFAQMPWQAATATLFGQVDARCERHGYRDPDRRRGEHGGHPPPRTCPAATIAPVDRLRPPDLIIQDELHLISGPLGTSVGLYETAVDELCSWSTDGKPVRPMFVASTATIRGRRTQVEQAVRPATRRCSRRRCSTRATPSSPARCRSTPATPGRRYLGVCAPGRRSRRSRSACTSRCWSAGQLLFDRLRRRGRPVHDAGRLLHRHPRAGRHAPPGRGRRAPTGSAPCRLPLAAATALRRPS